MSGCCYYTCTQSMQVCWLVLQITCTLPIFFQFDLLQLATVTVSSMHSLSYALPTHPTCPCVLLPCLMLSLSPYAPCSSLWSGRFWVTLLPPYFAVITCFWGCCWLTLVEYACFEALLCQCLFYGNLSQSVRTLYACFVGALVDLG